MIPVGAFVFILAFATTAPAQIIDKQKALDAQTFWDNRDAAWFRANIPFFDCPDPDITTTYYYRWELVTKHLTYGSPASGYSFTEFIDRPFWSGAYGAISCPAGHQLYEVRWLRDPRYAWDYAKYWFRTPGAQPRRYSTWLADAVWATHQAHPDAAAVKELFPDLVKNYQGWEEKHFSPEVGLFWQTGHDDGMEFNINSRQTRDILRGAPAYRPTLNAYLWADALAVAKAADLAEDGMTSVQYRAKAAKLKENIQAKLWDQTRKFFYPLSKQDEQANGFTVKAHTLTYQTGQFAGNAHGRELIGYVPWQFNLPDAGRGYETGWKLVKSKEGFAAPFGPRTVEINDPMYLLQNACCWWSGHSWPYATAQTLKGMANLLQNYQQDAVTAADYTALLGTFAKSHRKNGKPYLAEACHPDTGSWEGHDTRNHSEHYFHSSFCDLVITGLVGLKVRDDDTLEVHPLAPAEWDYFALDDVPYRGRTVSIVWDRTGTRYGKGAGFRLYVGGKEVAAAAKLEPLTAVLPPTTPVVPAARPINYAANNDGTLFPRAIASFTGAAGNLSQLNDGNYWYHVCPPNRWTCEGSKAEADWCGIDFGTPRSIDTVKLYFLHDQNGVTRAPESYHLEAWDGAAWKEIPAQARVPAVPVGRQANVVTFPRVETARVRAVLTHRRGAKSGLSEFEAWGSGSLPVQPAPPPKDDLALNLTGQGFPKATASFTDRFGGSPMAAIDGKVNFRPEPMNRWTSYESPNATDWLAIDFGAARTVGRVELGIYDDRGGVQPPASYVVQHWDGAAWKDVANAAKVPEVPIGNRFNEIRFDPVATAKVRITFTNNGRARSGVTEVMVFEK
ncbi:hypothetical protein FRUB_06369 [Fimbriiglobus ruber]|uniref:F5/8 type C domain-containing protein n=1 Tax=Fimbriiglobus ruber TaxID=1908690 RepID=A0A225DGQ3_9BACT|nr:hypothetical protein FRUB_06369 [Fimbriiglobus ruber]